MADAGRVALRLRIRLGDRVAIGPGKADLLDAIDAHGSISAAARALGMSYRRAWLLVEEMNGCFVASLVETRPGAGAKLTDAARVVLAAYRRAAAVAEEAAASETAMIGGLLKCG